MFLFKPREKSPHRGTRDAGDAFANGPSSLDIISRSLHVEHSEGFDAVDNVVAVIAGLPSP